LDGAIDFQRLVPGDFPLQNGVHKPIPKFFKIERRNEAQPSATAILAP
jgi:hypothetical protein